MIEITPVILSFNEEENIERVLSPLHWAARIVVLDSGSSDNTVAIASGFANVVVHTRPFDDHTTQWNHGLSLVETDWVLTLDADYITDAEFAAELQKLRVASGTNAFFADFIYCVLGKPLRASLYPPRAVLFRRNAARYVQDGHTQLLQFDGKSGNLRTPILHDDRKPLERWLSEQNKYAVQEAEHLLRGQRSASGPERPTARREARGQEEEINLQDRIRRKIFIAPLAVFFYTLFAKGLILDGWPGWFYVAQRTIAELLLSVRLLIEREKLEP
jgi:glycosyltransferase involved in cell wall biosynthesis